MDTPVSSIMTTPVRSVSADDTVELVGRELRRHGLHFMPVLDSPHAIVIGVVSISDLLQFELTKRDPASVHAWEICSYKPLEVSPDTPLGEVARQMLARGIHHVIVTHDGEMKGIVSSLDFVKKFTSRDFI